MLKSKSILRWAGSKSQQIGRLVPYWESIECPGRYIEAFAGSACLFFAIRPEKAVLNDINEDLMGALKELRQNASKLHREVSRIPRDEKEYYAWRALNPSDLSSFEKAIRFIYLNRNCFNGLWRTNARGEFNVPFGGGYKAGELPSEKCFLQCAEALKAAELHTLDFELLLRNEVTKGDFVYLDPPFAVSNRRVFRQYSAQSFGMQDLHRLKDLLIEIDRRDAKFLLSYADSPELTPLSAGWQITRTKIQRNISGFSKHRRVDKEAFVTNIRL